MIRFQIQDENDGLIKQLRDQVLVVSSTTKKALASWANVTPVMTHADRWKDKKFQVLEFDVAPESVDTIHAILEDLYTDTKRKPFAVTWWEIQRK